MLKDYLARTVRATVTDENDNYVFAQVDGHTFRIAKKELKKVPRPGAVISGFAYQNEHHQLVMTKQVPKVGRDQYAWGTVVGSHGDLGVFVDIGLPDKDIAISSDDLPLLRHLWPQKGSRLLLALTVDDKDRIWGKLATDDLIRQVSVQADKRMMNREVTATVYRLKRAGTLVLTSDYYLGFIYHGEREQEPYLGQVVQARVIDVHADGRLNLSLQPRAYEAISEDAQMILAALKQNQGHLPYTDKSTPAAIKAYFGISKGQFKRSVGHLMKAGLVQQREGELILNEQQ
ncbi:CvfB family protein [Ligilactobacillus saerimneri]|uniref:DNA-binding protein n=2 Tax=Ligilactobacillus saerimneri TaxID=228229 RepID=M5J4M0_9LACO|nr:S1-like domain-containing RNA-binding protein [Ligilactobacillus saerimneri]EKW98596.1 hypothetical protein D271_06300 [Ligilactobacillus saerimneri 30a]KRL73560.1 hypothetical protein FC54_GL000499 [Ligilactobacillus saerimneri DSM 16049]MBU5309052.1 DNA-binding protein [Ligilactobacillus saerimneri]MDI9205695.1 S1-like domain-containing RNA-binding protein [Ligilactobacillus saerimneri]QLL77886.1 DNA-binding protein [Ligilactobacillus saerimneri]